MSLPGIEQVAFSKIKGITPETAGAILAAVGSEAEFFRMSERELAELAGAGSHIFAASYRDGLLCEAEKELDFVARNGIRCLYFRNQDYPARFQNVPDAPCVFYNLNGYYNPMAEQLDRMLACDLTSPERLRGISFARNLDELVACLQA